MPNEMNIQSKSLGSIGIDIVNSEDKVAVGVKNYAIENDSTDLIRAIVALSKGWNMHLPQEMRKQFYVDLRGQNVSSSAFDKIRQEIVEKSNKLLTVNDIVPIFVD